MIFVAKRVVLAVIVLFVVTLLSFVLLHNLPGDPCIAKLGPSATANGLAQCRHQLGLDRSLPAQYIQYLNNSLHGNLGISYLNGQTVGTAVRQALPITVELLVLSQLMALIVAIPVGILAAVRPDGVFDQLSTGVAFGLLAFPAFMLGVFLVYLFAVRLHIFPATGWTPLTQDFGQNLRHAFLPSLTLALGSLAVYMRVLRTDMIATLREDFITTARAKGMPNSQILLRHALRPSTFALITVAGINIGTLITGAFLVEFIFQLPGIGLLTLNSIYARDYGIVQATVLVVAVGFVVINLAVDLLYAAIDPRTRHARASA